ncbi:hypothetical protein D1007_34225 [Hordeum vulgare]|nr:hypothetical protein D1007_34225 [Hordeum vulgare]
MMWLDMWNAQRNSQVETDQTQDTNEAPYLRQLEWMHKREIVGAHLDYGPLHDRVGTELWRCINDSNVVLGRAVGPETDGLVRSTLQKVANPCRTLAALLSCHGVSSTDVRARPEDRMDEHTSARPSSI